VTQPEDRIAVPTNGHHPRLHEGDLIEPELDPPTDLGAGSPSFTLPAIRPTVPNVTPTQAAVGFGIVAALILLLLGRRRGGRG
jgi:hypothetical protein